MIGHTQQMLERWGDGDLIDVPREMALLTMEVACDTLFGAGVGEDARTAIEEAAALQTYFERWATRGLQLPWSVPTPANLRVLARVRRVDAILYRIIRDRRAAVGQSGTICYRYCLMLAMKTARA